ncbi:glutaredoxin domain-containing protein [uncultured Helcococcus sp.]|uniref:glutaredoxin family protein n=1 Tax=uncultured Helcococcus sp. TaxID=1072508 RepID=UPI0026236260|nr:glutaredoxin domain-containing protein [uncultured Helcococcus sp.]
MSKEINLYTNTGCSKCKMLKRWLEMKGISYQELNIGEDDKARQNLINKGYRQLPQIEIDGEIVEFAEYNDILEHI